MDVRQCAATTRGAIGLLLVYRGSGDYETRAVVLDAAQRSGTLLPVPHELPASWFVEAAASTPSGGALFGGTGPDHRAWLLELGPEGQVLRDVLLPLDGARRTYALASRGEGWVALTRVEATPGNVLDPAPLAVVELDGQLSVVRERVVDDQTVSVTNLARDGDQLAFIANRGTSGSSLAPFLVRWRADGAVCERSLPELPANGEALHLVNVGVEWFVGMVTPRVAAQSNAAHMVRLELGPCTWDTRHHLQ